jgi:xylulokinase
LYDTDGSVGAARGAGIGAGVYASPAEAFDTLRHVGDTEPDTGKINATRSAYAGWKLKLLNALGN